MSLRTNLDRLAASISQAADWVATIANALGTIVVLVLVAVMNVDVVARNFFNAPFRGVVEVVIFSMILIVFLQLPDVIRVNRLTRSDGFMAVVGQAYPWVGRVLTRAVDGLACVFMALAAYATWPVFVETIESCSYITPPEFGPPFTGNLLTDLFEATERCDYFGTPGVFTAPWWPVRMVITLSAGLGSVLFLFKSIYAGRRLELVRLPDQDN